LDSDVNLLVVKNFIKAIRQKAVGFVISAGEEPENVLLKIIKDELIEILGKNQKPLKTDSKISKIMMVGLQGSGKTTTCAKIAYYYKNKHAKKPLLVGIDIYRPAAIEQLRVLAKEIDVDFFEKGTQNPVKTCDEAIEFANKNGNDLIIFDTAGRLQTNDELMDELKNVRNKVSPDEILMVVDAMSGQDIVNVATVFNDVLTLTGFVLTKLDNDVPAGAALSLISLLNLPIKLTGSGEKVGSLDIFYPERMADRILGLGDIMTLAEKASDVLDESRTKKSIGRMLAGKMDLEDLMYQMQQMSKMGSLGSVMKMLPNAPKINESQIGEAEDKMRK
jgi:signal recognition particle subunit SRP54